MTLSAGPRITYTSTTGDLEDFHRRFDAGLAAVRSKAGREHAARIDGAEVRTNAPPIVDTAPADTRTVLGTFTATTSAEVDRAVRAARGAQKD